ncbi:hypothetical protein BDR04DRAFT_290823 [Suillus decipiens]|nr:hypothetical protein BDR04DRAFT_290823 [Suillus decipiens]
MLCLMCRSCYVPRYHHILIFTSRFPHLVTDRLPVYIIQLRCYRGRLLTKYVHPSLLLNSVCRRQIRVHRGVSMLVRPRLPIIIKLC